MASSGGLLLNPNTFDPPQLDPESRRQLRALIEWFEERGKVRLLRDDLEATWVTDFLDFIKRERLFATFLTPSEFADGDANKRWDTSRNAVLSEILGFYGLAYWYAEQVTILGLGPIWQSDNVKAKEKAAAQLEAGRVMAFGLSERDHGADIYNTDMLLTPATSHDTEGVVFRASGEKYYTGNGNVAGMVSVFSRRTDIAGAEGYVWFVADSAPVYEKHSDVPNVARFYEQVQALKELLTTAAPDAEQQADLDFVLVVGHLFTLVVYGQLILEQAELTGLDRDLVDQIFDAAIRDFSAYAVALHGKPSSTPTGMGVVGGAQAGGGPGPLRPGLAAGPWLRRRLRDAALAAWIVRRIAEDAVDTTVPPPDCRDLSVHRAASPLFDVLMTDTTCDPAPAARAFFAAKLAHEIDPADLAAARAAGNAPIVVDTRSAAAWQQGHIPGALHIPGRELRQRALDELPDRGADIVVYCWGPGCNGATRAAFTLSDMRYRRVRELIGGFEYWTREGFSIVGRRGRARRPVDDLTAVPPHGGSVNKAGGHAQV